MEEYTKFSYKEEAIMDELALDIAISYYNEFGKKAPRKMPMNTYVANYISSRCYCEGGTDPRYWEIEPYCKDLRVAKYIDSVDCLDVVGCSRMVYVGNTFSLSEYFSKKEKGVFLAAQQHIDVLVKRCEKKYEEFKKYGIQSIPKKETPKETIEDLKKLYPLDPVSEELEVFSISRQAKLSEDQTISFYKANHVRDYKSGIIKTVSERVATFTEEDVLEILMKMKAGWENSYWTESGFNYNYSYSRLYQYAPFELMGINELRYFFEKLEDFLKVKNIKFKQGLDFSTIVEAYYRRLYEYLEKNNIKSEEDLESLVVRETMENSYYPDIIKKRMVENSSFAVQNIIKNWKETDTKSFQIFESRKDQPNL